MVLGIESNPEDISDWVKNISRNTSSNILRKHGGIKETIVYMKANNQNGAQTKIDHRVK